MKNENYKRPDSKPGTYKDFCKNAPDQVQAADYRMDKEGNIKYLGNYKIHGTKKPPKSTDTN